MVRSQDYSMRSMENVLKYIDRCLVARGERKYYKDLKRSDISLNELMIGFTKFSFNHLTMKKNTIIAVLVVLVVMFGLYAFAQKVKADQTIIISLLN